MSDHLHAIIYEKEEALEAINDWLKKQDNKFWEIYGGDQDADWSPIPGGRHELASILMNAGVRE